MVDKTALTKKMVDKWSTKRSFAKKMVDILIFALVNHRKQTYHQLVLDTQAWKYSVCQHPSLQFYCYFCRAAGHARNR